MPKTLIIAANSARSYALAAVACGYQVITLDAFADADTRRVSLQSFMLKMRESGPDEQHFKQTFASINLDEVDGFLYGSLFDAAPDLLAWVAKQLPLIGNTPDVMRAAKQFSFFKLLDELNITHPQVRQDLPNHVSGWLLKQVGGSGGTHIRPANQFTHSEHSPHDYFQQKMAGIPVSMLFLADGESVQLIGFNRQFLASTPDMPYRFAGAVSHVPMPSKVQHTFLQAAQRLTKALGLRGINNLDAILDENTLWMLELNPRLSASFQLYENLLTAHIQCCAGDSLLPYPLSVSLPKAQLILYADDALDIPPDFMWPDWATDIPVLAQEMSDVKLKRIHQHAPICSVLAEAESAKMAMQLVFEREKQLKEMLYREK